MQKTCDDFFDLATVSGVFGKYAKKSKLVVWLVQGIHLVKFAVDTLELFLELRANGRAQYAKTPRAPCGNRGGIIQYDSQIIRSMALHPYLQAEEDPSASGW